MKLYHHGIKGQKWGIRRYQNEDGTLTYAGKKRYGNNHVKLKYKTTSEVSRKDLSDIYNTFSKEDTKMLSYKSAVSQDHIKSFLTKYGDVPISSFSVTDEGDGAVSLTVMTRNEKRYRNKGYASENVKLGMDWVDNNPEILSAIWGVHKDNTASIKLAKKHGFKEIEGIPYKDWTAYIKEYKRD